jgi:hypothetical protein
MTTALTTKSPDVNAKFPNSEYQVLDQEILNEISSKYDWISGPIQRASNYVRQMPFFEFVDNMKSPRDFKDAGLQLYYHSATFPKVMGLMLGLTPLAENHMMSFYAEHASGESTHHQMLLQWMLDRQVIGSADEISQVIPTIETNACVNLAYQMAIEQDRDKWLVSLNCGIERCSNEFFKAVAPKMHAMGAGDPYFDVHVEADEHHSIMGLDYITKDPSEHRKSVLVAKSLEGITLWAAMIHSWIGITAVPVFANDGTLAKRKHLACD